MSEDLKDILKCVLIWGIILIFASYLLADAEILGNVKQQERPETSVMIGAGSNSELAGKPSDHIHRRYHIFSTGSETFRL